MKLVADEGVDRPIVERLRSAGFVVTYFAEEAPGAEDSEVLAHAASAGQILITCDKDFGELVYRNRLTSSGVLLVRLAGLPAEAKALIVLEAIRDHAEDMLGAFSVVSPGLLRIRRRPSEAS